MTRNIAIGALLVTALLVPVSGASAEATLPVETTLSTEVAPPADEITVDIVTVNGSGCPIGSAATVVSPDAQAFTVIYSQYIAETISASRVAEKNCQINIIVNAPPAFTYAIARTDYRGYKSLSTKARAELLGVYYFTGQSITSYISHPIEPGEGLWQISDEVPFTSLVYKPCGDKLNLNINTRMRILTGATVGDFLAMDSTDGEFSTKYHFSWMQC